MSIDDREYLPCDEVTLDCRTTPVVHTYHHIGRMFLNKCPASVIKSCFYRGYSSGFRNEDGDIIKTLIEESRRRRWDGRQDHEHLNFDRDYEDNFYPNVSDEFLDQIDGYDESD
jgi:hypothetical protein